MGEAERAAAAGAGRTAQMTRRLGGVRLGAAVAGGFALAAAAAGTAPAAFAQAGSGTSSTRRSPPGSSPPSSGPCRPPDWWTPSRAPAPSPSSPRPTPPSAKLPAGTLEALLRDPARLRARAHLPRRPRPGDWRRTWCAFGGHHRQGESIRVTAAGRHGAPERGATVLQTDLMASNGVIHVVDSRAPAPDGDGPAPDRARPGGRRPAGGRRRPAPPARRRAGRRRLAPARAARPVGDGLSDRATARRREAPGRSSGWATPASDRRPARRYPPSGPDSRSTARATRIPPRATAGVDCPGKMLSPTSHSPRPRRGPSAPKRLVWGKPPTHPQRRPV